MRSHWLDPPRLEQVTTTLAPIATTRGSVAQVGRFGKLMLFMQNPSLQTQGMSQTTQRVAVVGASDDPGRYAYRAIQLLLQHGHDVLPVTPKPVQLPGLTVYPDLPSVPVPIDTVTLYVNPRVVESIVEDLLVARPRRVIFNPGTEHPAVARRLEAAGVETLEACTLVLLSTGQFG